MIPTDAANLNSTYEIVYLLNWNNFQQIFLM